MAQKSDKKIFHSLEANAALDEFKVDPHRGLSSSEADERQRQYGRNELPKSSQDSAFRIFIRQFQDPFIYVLLASSLLAILLGKITDGFVVLGVVIINSIIGFIQEFRAGKAIEALSAMISQKTTVVRDGNQFEVDASQLVPGDLVVLRSGDKVTADLRLLDVKSLKIEEAALTGESVPVDKSTQPVRPEAGLGDQTSMAFSGTLVTYGVGRGVVTATGAATELGNISSMLSSTSRIQTPLTQSLSQVSRLLTAVITVVALILFGVGLWRDFPLVDAVLAAITLAVAAIPEGLPAIVTITLAIGVRRMASRRAVIRKLPAVETLGSTSVICTDKTGTLTKNEMTVQALWTPTSHTFRVSGTGYEPQGDLLKDGVSIKTLPKDITTLLKAGVLCNDSKLLNEEGSYTIQGDPTEGALLVAFEKVGGSVDALNRGHRRLSALPFESELQYMATLNQNEEADDTVLYIKGAPEVVAQRSQNGAHIEQSHKMVQQFASEGMRVLAFAQKKVPGSTTEITSDLLEEDFEFLGLQAMIDPPRPEVIESISACHTAGITVKMITGDHKETALAIGQQVGIYNGQPVVTGDMLRSCSDEEVADWAQRSNIFARVSPEHKLRLVQAIQKKGHVAAMTGDGVNDAPALKQANIGIAMGITGTSVSKESADLVLLDDNFTTIKAAVEEGRRIYDNLVKSLAFVLPTNLGEALIILVAVLFFPIAEGQALMPISPVQILWINLVATVTLALPLAFETKEPNIMKRPPRDPKEPIINRFVMIRTTIVALLMAAGAIALFLYEYDKDTAAGISPDQALRKAQTIAVTTVIFFQIFYLFNCRTMKTSIFRIGLFSNPAVYVGIGILLVLQLLFVEAPLMNAWFASASLSPLDWLKALAVGALIMPVIGIEKRIRGDAT